MPSPAAERGSATVTLATVAALLLLIVAVIAGAAGGITGQEAAACTAQPAASSAAAAIPANYLADFRKAGTEYGIPWTVLAAIGYEESGFGADDGPSSAGALGPMQFLPSTWQQFGDGGNIMNPDDAIPAAARLLVAHGAPGNLQQALLAYNDAGWYVTEVLDLAARYAAGGAQALSAAGSAVCQQAALGPGHDGLPLRRDRHTAHQPGPVGLRPAGPRQPGPARRPGLLLRGRRHPGRPRARRHRPEPGRTYHDQRLHRRFPGRSGHLRASDVQGRPLAGRRIHPPLAIGGTARAVAGLSRR
jgi:hypothetical protein